MNGMVKARLQILEDGHSVLSINGHIVPNVLRVTQDINTNETPSLIVTLHDVDFAIVDDRNRTPIYENPEYRKTVEDAYHDGRTICCRAKGESEWQQRHRVMAPFPAHSFNWDSFDYSLLGDRK